MNGKSQWIVAPPLALELVWEGGGLARIRLDWSDGRESGADLAGPPARMAEALKRYVAGEKPDWPELPLVTGGLSDFSRRVLETLAREVPHGGTVSYGGLAAMCGRPAAARAVGRVMAANPWPLVVPCHRVIGGDGSLTGFSGSGLPMKRYLLELEGALQPAKA